jgi:hypothetical protein
MTNLNQLTKANKINSKLRYEIDISEHPLIPNSPLKQDSSTSLNFNTRPIPKMHLTSECLTKVSELQAISRHVVTGTIVQLPNLPSGSLIAGEEELQLQHVNV